MYLILKNGTYAQGDFKPEGAIEVPQKPSKIETTWDGTKWVETEDSKALQYLRDRLEEYPSLQDCIHALLDGGDTLTELQTKRSDIKKKYPKPT